MIVAYDDGHVCYTGIDFLEHPEHKHAAQCSQGDTLQHLSDFERWATEQCRRKGLMKETT